jgi:PIN domain nuclease of toxin-antitoxin system
VVPFVRYLLDTHAWLWAVLGHPRLSVAARRALGAIEREHLGLAAISLEEAVWLLARGRIVVTKRATSWSSWLREAATAPELEVLPLTVEIAIESEQFAKDFPTDPADRLIGATAKVHDLTLITADAVLRRQEAVRTLW